MCRKNYTSPRYLSIFSLFCTKFSFGAKITLEGAFLSLTSKTKTSRHSGTGSQMNIRRALFTILVDSSSQKLLLFASQHPSPPFQRNESCSFSQTMITNFDSLTQQQQSPAVLFVITLRIFTILQIRKCFCTACTIR